MQNCEWTLKWRGFTNLIDFWVLGLQIHTLIVRRYDIYSHHLEITSRI